MTRFWIALTSLLVLLAPLAAEAQTTTPRVRIEDFTVDGNPPPDEYRTMLTNAIQPTIALVERCYDQRLPTNPTLAGDFRLRLWVSAREVIRTTPESSLGDAQLERCTRDAILTFRLPPQAPEGGATVRFVVRFTAPPRTAVATTTPATTTPTPTTTTPATTEALTNPRVRVTVESVRGTLAAPSLENSFPAIGFEACANGTTGTVPMSVTIDARGRIRASAGRGTLRDRAVSRCVVERLQALTGPTSRGRTRVRAVFEFVR